MRRPKSKRKSPPKKRGAKKATSYSVHSQKQITAICTRFQLEGPLLTYRDVRRQLNSQYGLNLSIGTVYRMAQGNYLPKDREIRRRLGLVKPHRPKLNRRKLAISLLEILHG